MIESVVIQGVGSYSKDNPVFVDTSKKINLFYGLNGSGKSTIGNLLQDPKGFSLCQINKKECVDIVVYNQKFIEENFYDCPDQKGVFTVGKENKDAEEIISIKRREIDRLEEERDVLSNRIDELRSRVYKKYNGIKDEVWVEKNKYEGGVLDFCLVKNSKDKFLQRIRDADACSREESISELAEEACTVFNENACFKREILPVDFVFSFDQFNELLRQPILGSNGSHLSDIIDKLNNSDWVNHGLSYRYKNCCPFCQQQLPDDFYDAVKNVFDKSYEEKISKLEHLKQSLIREKNSLEGIFLTDAYRDDFVVVDGEFNELKSVLFGVIDCLIDSVDSKLNSPSSVIDNVSGDFDNTMRELNKRIEIIAQKIRSYNDKLDKKKLYREDIIKRFWSVLRGDYFELISAHDRSVGELNEEIARLEVQINNITHKIHVCDGDIEEQLGNISSVDGSIHQINNCLKDLGITSFYLEKVATDSSSYRISRGEDNNVYRTLSEGEKTLISFLYFIQLCNGNVDAKSSIALNSRVVVVDDPISSLSHNYIYDVASLMQRKLIEGDFSQVFVLTHNLFFFHELIKQSRQKGNKFNKCYGLHRVIKGDFSSISEIESHEIENDYQSYWSVLRAYKEKKVSHVVVPNMMRNILEYYFSFVHQENKLYEILQCLEGEDKEFRSFYRYINRESHSDGVNIHDFCSFDPGVFFEKFKLIFIRCDFEHHYQIMMGEDIE